MFAFVALASAIQIQSHEEKSFLAWMRSTNSFYTGDEYKLRLGIYLGNSRYVQEHNQASSFKLSMNKFAALTHAEYLSLLGHKPNGQNRNAIKKVSKVKADTSVDWRNKKVVNDIKDQGSCGSCWAFGTVQACESAYAIATGKLYSCSEQNLVDCVTKCSGCNGGLESYALDYIIQKQNGYLMSEDDYPYKAYEGTCKFDSSKGLIQIKSYEHGVEGDEDYLAELVTRGVCDVAIDAGQYSFQLYSSGIYDESRCSSYNLNHAVGCVGYGTESGVDYWIIRNSWGPSWGEDGYIRMSRNKNNQCGVASDALLPLA